MKYKNSKWRMKSITNYCKQLRFTGKNLRITGKNLRIKEKKIQ